MSGDVLEVLKALLKGAEPEKWPIVSPKILSSAIAAIEERDAEIVTLTRQLAEARAFGENAAKLYNDTLVLRCAFCGEAYEDGTPPSRHERLTVHVGVCPQHPMREIERQLAAKGAEIARLRGALERISECACAVPSYCQNERDNPCASCLARRALEESR